MPLQKSQPTYKCQICGDTGTKIVTKNNKDYAMPCFCVLRQKKARLFGAIFEDKTLDNYEGRNASMREAKRRMKNSPDKSFYIYGNVGLGKTHLLAGLFDLFFEDGRWTETIILTETQLKEAMKRTDDRINLQQSTTVMIDDLGKIGLADWEIQSTFNFYNDVYRYDLQLVISSNYSLEQIAEIYGGAIARRIEERCEIILIKPGDDRGEKK
jgi:DNA replication protein DnaC